MDNVRLSLFQYLVVLFWHFSCVGKRFSIFLGRFQDLLVVHQLAGIRRALLSAQELMLLRLRESGRTWISKHDEMSPTIIVPFHSDKNPALLIFGRSLLEVLAGIP